MRPPGIKHLFSLNVYRPNGQVAKMKSSLARKETADLMTGRLVDQEIDLDCRAVPLHFTVRLARTPEQLQKAVGVRSLAYAKRLPALARILASAEDEDQIQDSIVLLAESKETRSPLGTMRIVSNRHAPTEFEQEVALPAKFRGRTIAQVSRLAVSGGRQGAQVKIALFKALYRYCLATQIDWIMATGIPPRDRDYVNMQFEDVFPGHGLIPLPSSMGIPARLMVFNVRLAEQKWRESNHPLYDFMCNQVHEDIRIFDSVSGAWAFSRARERMMEPPLEFAPGLSLDLLVV